MELRRRLKGRDDAREMKLELKLWLHHTHAMN